MYRSFSFCCALLLLLSCGKNDKLDIDISSIEIETKVNRFEQDFYKAKPEGLADLKSKYPYLFPLQNPDSVWIAKMQDKDELLLLSKADSVFHNFEKETNELTDLFQHVKYYYPAFKAPKVITLLTNVDYQTRVIYADSLMLIPLDLYLGKNSEIYNDFPVYIKQNFVPERMVVDAAESITRVQIPLSNDRTFVSRIIQEGKKLYLYDAYLPKYEDTLKIGYTAEQLNWAEVNQIEVWKYFIQNELLFSTDAELNRRFIEQAPFSKFFQAKDHETPGSIGVWFGWQIVRAFMDNTNTTLSDLLVTPNEVIYKKSKYKPVK